MTYIFDTSSFITWWHEIYPPQFFPDISTLIEHGINENMIQSVMEVKRELSEQKDDLFAWVKQQPNDLFVKDQENQQARIAELSNQYPKLVKQHKKYNADPIVIALAESNNWTVVTQESPNKQNNIVGCCRDIGIKCISLTQYIKINQQQLEGIRRDLYEF